jgi:hypothetical protein
MAAANELGTRTGGCHCGRVRYEVMTDLASVLDCNCSHCSKRGALWNFVPADRFTLTAGGEGLVDYQFNKKLIHHLFCPACGIESFACGKGPDGNDIVAVNVRCLDGIEIGALKLTPINGRDL